MKKILAVAVTVPALILTTFAGVTLAATTPSAPHNLVVTNVGSGTFDTKWQTVTNATEYQIFVNGSLKAVSKDNTERITGLNPCTKLYFQTAVKVNGVLSPLATGSGSKTITPPTSCTTTPTPTPTTTTPAPTPTATTTPTPAPTTTAPAPTVDQTSAASKLGWGTPIAAGSDEFNYVGAPNSLKWNNYDTAGHHGNGRRMKAQSTVNGSVLTQIGLPNGDTGYLSSKYRPGTMYGKWETRMKTNARDAEYHPVLLLTPSNGLRSITEDEVDYAESTVNPSEMKFYLHYGDAGTTTQTRAMRVIDTTQWHNYAVEWSPAGVKGYLDGELWFTDTNPEHNPNQDMHQAIQLDWFPDGTTLTQSEMQVDWTRTYK